ncbi:DUF4123 domain-containing protein [Marinobacter halodurans]|nr:DUF4123 domain-containing protein [Marinobacter halodurans]
MDAASYINTLEQLGLEQRQAAAPTFAVVDLAVDESFLGQLYGAMTSSAITWSSLLTGTRWESAWKTGPILVKLSGHEKFASDIAQDMANQPLGMLIETPLDASSAHTYFQSLLLSTARQDETLFRFYEPRMLTALLAALGEKRHRLIRKGEAWSWHDGYDWKACRSDFHAATDLSSEPPKLSSEELASVPQYRTADKAIRYRHAYRSHLPDAPDQTVWIMARLLEARESGLKSSALQERWLRLALQHGASFQKTPPFEKVMHDPSMTPQERLMAMESLSESSHAAVSG